MWHRRDMKWANAVGKNDTDRLAQHRLATKLQCVKNWISAKCNTAKCSKTRCAGVYSNSCPLSWWCHPTISSSVIPFSSRLQSFPASGSFPMSQFFASGGQSIGVSASASVLPMNIQDWFPLGWAGWISLQSKESCPTPQSLVPHHKTLKSLVQHHSSKASILRCSAFFIVHLSHPSMQ